MRTRREFCLHVYGAASLATASVLLQACGGSPTSPSNGSGNLSQLPSVMATVVNGVATLTIDGASPLATVGSMALVQSALGPFLVSRTAQDSFTALTAICTHEQCTITEFSGQRYVCPCHGSQYTTSGGVLNGPATVALRQIATSFANNVLTISG